jgi:transposase InsO family protein
MKYRFIYEYREHFALALLCRVLEVSRSGYYAWCHRSPLAPGVRQQQDQQLTEQIQAIHAQSRQTYGSPRIHAELQAQGIYCGEKRVARLMQAAGLQARPPQRYQRTTDSRHSLPVAPNHLQQQFEVAQVNQVWSGDITYVWTQEGWLYLAVVLDLCSRRVIGWAMSHCLDTELVVRALMMAWQQRCPGVGLLHHSDRGSQYASLWYQGLLEQWEMVGSMSGKGNCWDNAPVESFFATLKTELIYRHRYVTREQARNAIFEYIEVFYNRQRRHSSLGYLSPVEYERQLLKVA